MHELHAGGRQQALGKIAAPIAVRRLAQIDSREIKEVEAEEDHRHVLVGRGDLALGLQLGAVLKRREGRFDVRVKGHQLAVQDHACRVLPPQLGGKPRELGRKLESFPRTQLDPVLVDEGEHPIAVELGLPYPVCAIEGDVTRFGEHGGERGRHRFELARGNEPRGGNAVRRDDLEVRDRQPGEHRAVLRGDIDDSGGSGEPVLVLDQKPLLLVLGAHQCEGALQLLAAQQDAQLAFFEAFHHFALRLPTVVEPGLAAFVGRVDAAIPDDHFAGAVLPGWNHALERGIVIRVIFDVHGKALFTRIERRALGNRPRLQDAFAFEPEVIVQLPGGMLLDDEQQRPAPGRGQRRRRLGCGRKGALGGIFGEIVFRHAGILGTKRGMHT